MHLRRAGERRERQDATQTSDVTRQRLRAVRASRVRLRSPLSSASHSAQATPITRPQSATVHRGGSHRAHSDHSRHQIQKGATPRSTAAKHRTRSIASSANTLEQPDRGRSNRTASERNGSNTSTQLARSHSHTLTLTCRMHTHGEQPHAPHRRGRINDHALRSSAAPARTKQKPKSKAIQMLRPQRSLPEVSRARDNTSPTSCRRARGHAPMRGTHHMMPPLHVRVRRAHRPPGARICGAGWWRGEA